MLPEFALKLFIHKLLKDLWLTAIRGDCYGIRDGFALHEGEPRVPLGSHRNQRRDVHSSICRSTSSTACNGSVASASNRRVIRESCSSENSHEK